MKKRVREEEEDGVEEGEEGGRDTVVPNQFGQWLLENIYKYADVRESDTIKALREEIRDYKTTLDITMDDTWFAFENYKHLCRVCRHWCDTVPDCEACGRAIACGDEWCVGLPDDDPIVLCKCRSPSPSQGGVTVTDKQPF